MDKYREYYDYWDCKPIIDKNCNPIIVSLSDETTVSLCVDNDRLTQESVYNAFMNQNWEDGKKYNFTKDTIFDVRESRDCFEVYVDNEYKATFCKIVCIPKMVIEVPYEEVDSE